MQTDTAPQITVLRMPYQSASRPIKTPPTEVPIQAREVASEGAERTPPKSTAMDFSPTTVIHIAPNDSARQTTEKLAATQEDRVSILEVLKLLPAVAAAKRLRMVEDRDSESQKDSDLNRQQAGM